jgi:superfamily II DNA or RNA helicase
MATLRPDQLQIVRAVEAQFYYRNKRLIVQMPTGSGKTVVAAEIARRMGLRRILYVVPSSEIFDQTAEKLRAAGVHPTLLQAGGWPNLANTRCLLAMSQTLSNRLAEGMFAKWLPDLIIVDEAHKLIDQHARVLQAFNCASIALTATPVRLDGRSLSNLWPTLIEGPSVPQLQSLGALVRQVNTLDLPLADLRKVKKRAGDYEAASLSKAYENSRAADLAAIYWWHKAKGRKTLAFCPSRAVSETLAAALNTLGAKAMHLDAKVKDDVREETLAKLARGELDVVTNCALFVEGVDVPSIDCVMVCTSTLSLTKWMQMVGRGTRSFTGKKDLLVIDHGHCTRRLGPVDCERDWTMGGKPI